MHKARAIQLYEEWVGILVKAVPQLRVIRFGDCFYASGADIIVEGFSEYVWFADSTGGFIKEKGTGVNVFELHAENTNFYW